MISKRAINLKNKLAAGGISPGIWMSLQSATTAEVIETAGFDWVLVDAEHASFNPETLHHMLMAFKGSETVPLIRVPWNDAVMIKQVLDMGWDGILVPQTNTAEEVERAVSACRYPPQGTRGFGPRRASNYFLEHDEYLKYANDSIICAVQVEHVCGAETIEEIVKIPGVDWVFVGRNDMSGSGGYFLDVERKELWDIVRKIFDTATSAGLPCGGAFYSVNDIEKTLDYGCPLVMLGEDMSFLRDGAHGAMKAFRDVLEKRK